MHLKRNSKGLNNMAQYPLVLENDKKRNLERIAKLNSRSLNNLLNLIIDEWLANRTADVAHEQTNEERAAALKTQGDWPDKTA